MLPDYGVVVGRYVNYTTNQGQWMHVDLNINAANVQYQAAVDVNEPNFSIRSSTNLTSAYSLQYRDCQTAGTIWTRIPPRAR